MNTTKWEAVAYGDLKRGDKVRVKHDSGDVFHGTVRPSFADDMSIDLDNLLLPALSRDSVVARGYSFERAVPERTLPTEPGWYARTLAVDWGNPIRGVYGLDDCGHWYLNERQISPPVAERLTKLVPSSEVEELRKRIESARSYVMDVNGPFGAYSEIRGRIVDLLDGEGRNV